MMTAATTNFERPFTPRTSLRSPRNFGNARFGRFATFDFSTSKFFFRETNCIFFSVFHHSRQILEEIGFFECQNQVPRGILLQMVKFPGLYDASSQFF